MVRVNYTSATNGYIEETIDGATTIKDYLMRNGFDLSSQVILNGRVCKDADLNRVFSDYANEAGRVDIAVSQKLQNA